MSSPFTATQKLGSTSYGTAWLARGPRGPVTLQVLDRPPGRALSNERLSASIDMLRGVAHPSVVRPLGFAEVQGERAVVYEYADGIDLATALAAHTFEADPALHVIGSIASALVACTTPASAAPHGDLHPRNLLLTADGTVKLLATGIARASDQAMDEVATAFLGTAGYLAPERIAGTVHPRSDLYTLGVLLSEIVTGKRPDRPDTAEIPHEAHRQRTLDALARSLDHDIRKSDILDLASALTAFDPEARPSPAEVAERCNTLIDSRALNVWRHEMVRPLLSAQLTYHSLPAIPSPIQEDTGPPRTALLVVAGTLLSLVVLWAGVFSGTL